MARDWIDEHLLGMPGCEKDWKAEWEWWRYQVGGKLFAATMTPGPSYDAAYAGRDLLSLKCDPAWAEAPTSATGSPLTWAVTCPMSCCASSSDTPTRSCSPS